MPTINIAAAKSNFSEIISRAAAGERFVIRRRERPVAVLINPAELERLERSARLAHRLAAALGQDEALLAQVEQQQVHPAMAAFGLWQTAAELNSLAEEIYADRQTPSQRSPADL